MPIGVVNTAASGDSAVVAAVTGKKIRVRNLSLWNQVATANNVKLRSGTTDLMAAVPLPLAVGLPVDLESSAAPGDFLCETVAGQALNINLSAATAVGGWLIYSLE